MSSSSIDCILDLFNVSAAECQRFSFFTRNKEQLHVEINFLMIPEPLIRKISTRKTKAKG
jgi:hypothetical protein